MTYTTHADLGGHSFGGLAALAHAIEGAVKPASLMLIEANPLGLLRTSGENDLYAMFGAMTRDYFAEFEAGRPDAARHVIDFYGGEGTFAAFPAKVRDYLLSPTHPLGRSKARFFARLGFDGHRLSAGQQCQMLHQNAG